MQNAGWNEDRRGAEQKRDETRRDAGRRNLGADMAGSIYSMLRRRKESDERTAKIKFRAGSQQSLSGNDEQQCEFEERTARKDAQPAWIFSRSAGWAGVAVLRFGLALCRLVGRPLTQPETGSAGKYGLDTADLGERCRLGDTRIRSITNKELLLFLIGQLLFSHFDDDSPSL